MRPFNIVILSARADNLIACVQALFEHEPALPRQQIIVVDDGARAGAEAELPGITWVTGEKPFIFARNANRGIEAAGTDVILLNDDARLLTRRGFSRLAETVQGRRQLGICSPGINGIIGNPRQKAQPGHQLRPEARVLAFVCVYIPWAVYRQVGPLDERFGGYGFDDNDYCLRVTAAGYHLAVWDGCVVDHSGELPSTFRTRPDLMNSFRQNRRLFYQKWRSSRSPGRQRPSVHPEPATLANNRRCVDLLYLAWNRLEFTQESFTTLLDNTDWGRVHELFVYDDGSEDGTRQWLADQVGQVPAPVRFVRTTFSSPVRAMIHFIESARAPILAKIDNDAMMPPGWLQQSLDVLDRHPELTMLGIEAMCPVNADPYVIRSYLPARFISGLGLYRRVAFGRSRPQAIGRYFGLEEWQQAQGQRIKTGWIQPALPVFLLDRLPFDPWRRHSESYVRRGWQRDWPTYNETDTLWRWRWPDGSTTAAMTETTCLNIVHLAPSRAGYTNVSILPDTEVDYVSLNERWPWEDGSFAQVCIRDVVEHLPDKVRTMNELWRVLRPGGRAEIAVLTTDGPGAWADPTHVSFWNRRSFLYYEAGNPYRERFVAHYGIQAGFRVCGEYVEQTVDGPRLTMILEAVK